MMKKRDLKSLYSWAESIASSSTPKKTEKRAKREQSATSEVESLSQDSHQGSYEKEDGFTVPSDTAVALRMIHGQFPKIDKVMKQDKDVRVFKLSTGQDDFAIMFFDDYVSQVNAIKSRLDGKHPSEDLVIFDWYINHILPIHMDAGITDFHLESILSGVGHQIQERHISLLIKAGLLVRQLAHERSYWLAIPNIGSLLKSLSQGRKELLSLLNRRQYKEILLSILEKKKLRMSQLDMRFHVRDLLGSGQLCLSHTPAGILVRIPRD